MTAQSTCRGRSPTLYSSTALDGDPAGAKSPGRRLGSPNQACPYELHARMKPMEKGRCTGRPASQPSSCQADDRKGKVRPRCSQRIPMPSPTLRLDTNGQLRPAKREVLRVSAP